MCALGLAITALRTVRGHVARSTVGVSPGCSSPSQFRIQRIPLRRRGLASRHRRRICSKSGWVGSAAATIPCTQGARGTSCCASAPPAPPP